MSTIRRIVKWYNRTFRGVVYAEDSQPEDPWQLPIFKYNPDTVRKLVDRFGPLEDDPSRPDFKVLREELKRERKTK